MRTTKRKSYSELKKFKTFEERFDYLKLSGAVGAETFGYDRILNQTLYSSHKWKKVRDEVIIRDNGCDLGIEGRDIYSRAIVHHINPISVEDITNRSDILFDPENLITTTHITHNAIHYSNESILAQEPIVRTPNDTCPWKK